MPPSKPNDTAATDRPRLIRAREGVVVTSSQDAVTGRRTYYLKVTETGEIFEFGEAEYAIWQQFEGGVSLDAAQRAVATRFGDGFQDRLRTFVADLAMRGLLGGDLPPDLVEEYGQSAKARWRPFLIDPAGPDKYTPGSTRFRLVLGDPNAFFGFLARWLYFFKYLRWPLAVAAFVGAMVLFKHAQYFSSDFHAVILQWGRVPHAVFTLFTINLLRVIAQGAVSRHFGARVRYMSIDLVYGVWPRFHEDKKGILLLERTPQLWSHSAPFFARLAFFAVGTLGWWWLRGNGSHLYQYCLLMSQAAIADFATATLPVFKNETYFWFCALQRDPLLQDRGVAAVRSMFFLGKGTPRHLSPIEKLALAIYGLSMLLAVVVIIMTLITFFVGLTGTYNGAGFAICVILVTLGTIKVRTIRALKARLLAERAARKTEKRTLRRAGARKPAMASMGEE